MPRCAIALFSAVVWIVAADVSFAQIYEWRDATGARHFTTDVEDLPANERENPQIVVRKSAWRSETTGQADSLDRRTKAEVVYDHSRRRRSAAPADAEAVIVPTSTIDISGPLAVASVELTQPFAETTYVPYSVPLVTTSFDRGRSRHLTLRMLLQDQFQLDRDGPFFYERRAGLGPRLQPFLPRGLPHGFPRGARVITR